jgi:hypothetical protein
MIRSFLLHRDKRSCSVIEINDMKRWRYRKKKNDWFLYHLMTLSNIHGQVMERLWIRKDVDMIMDSEVLSQHSLWRE